MIAAFGDPAVAETRAALSVPVVGIAVSAIGEAAARGRGRRLAAMGHTVQLIPPQYVKPFVRRGKNDRNDAEAISEAAARPDMPSVPVKLVEQQAQAIVLSARELLVRQRSQLVNAVRGRDDNDAGSEIVIQSSPLYSSPAHFWLCSRNTSNMRSAG